MPFGYVIANVHTTRPEQMAEYRKARQAREGAGVFNMICVEGL